MLARWSSNPTLRLVVASGATGGSTKTETRARSFRLGYSQTRAALDSSYPSGDVGRLGFADRTITDLLLLPKDLQHLKDSKTFCGI